MGKLITVHFRWHFNTMKLSAVSLALTIALISCNTTPKNTDSNGTRKPWKSSNTNATALTTGYLSDQDWTSATSSWGPVSKNLAYGEGNPADRKKITLSGTQYEKGLGTHADSSITFKLDPSCSRFKASIGLDDQVRWQTEHGNVLFQIYGDNNTKLFDSQSVDRTTATKDVDVDVSGQSSLKLVVDQNKNSTEGDQSDWYDQANWANARVECAGTNTPPPPTPPSTNAVSTGYLSDQSTLAFNQQNGWGPIEFNMANGDDVIDTSSAYYNGHEPPITLKSGVIAKGLGVHASSSIEFPLGGKCSSFSAVVGLDQAYLDKAGHTVNFQVLIDGAVKRESGVMNKDSTPMKLEVDLTGAQTLKLVVTDGGDGNTFDHADWADAKVTCSGVSNPTPPAPPAPTPPAPTDSKNVLTYGARGDGVADDSAAIQATIDAASSGEVVFLPAPAAFYRISGTIQITKPLTLLGADSLIKNLTDPCPTYIEIMANDVQIRGLHLTGPQQTCGYAIHVGSAGGPLSNIKIENNQLDNFYNGVTLIQVDGLRVSGNALSNMDYYGILGSAVKNGVIDKNTVRGVWGNNSGGNAYGIVLSRDATIPTNPRSTDVVVSNNFVEDVPVWECYDTHGGQRIQFIDNTCKNAKLGINVAFSGKGQDDPDALAPLECEVRGNTVEKNAAEPYRDAIVFAGTYTQTATGSITGNTVIGFGPTGIYTVNANVTQLNNTRK